jgi:hypothetical protein
MKIWEGNKCRCWYRLRFRYLHLLTMLEQDGMCGVCAAVPPANITYAKNDNSKVCNLNDGPTLHKRF